MQRPRTRPLGPRRLAAVVALVAVLAASGTTAAATPAYRWPSAGAVVRGFAAPVEPWAPGHRGVDLDVPAGTSVGAMAAGVVAFAGPVAGTTWASVDHADGIRTTVGPLTALSVTVGDVVDAGERLAAAAGDAHGEGDSLHVGARRGAVYLDPLTLVEPGEVTLVETGEVQATGVGEPVDALPTLVPRAPPSPNRLVVLGGLGSSTDNPPLDPAVLGYHGDDVEHFSYAGLDAAGPRTYDAADTWARVHVSAELLADQLRVAQRLHPGRAVDLVGHSLGGLVAMYYLLVLHDPTDPSLPPLGRVATIASPLRGADLAAGVADSHLDPVLHVLLRIADAVHEPLSLDAPVLADLEPGSDVVAALEAAWQRARQDPWAGPLATGTDVLAIGALLDPVVPTWRSGLDDMPARTTLDTHGGAPRGDVTGEIVRAFLAGRPLPPPGPGERLATVLRPGTMLVSLAERLAPLPG